MTKIILNDETRAKLPHPTESAEFTDAGGNTIGYFTSEKSFDRMASVILPMPTDEEIAEARKEMLEQGGISTEDLLARINRINREWEERR